MTANSKLFVLYDGRAKFGCTDSAMVMDTATSEKQAAANGAALWDGFDAVWYEYDCGDNSELVNEKIRLDLPPNRKG